MSGADPLNLAFELMSLDHSPVAACYYQDHRSRAASHLKTQNERTQIEPRGMMVGYSDTIQSASGEVFHFAFANVLNVNHSTSEKNEDSRPLSPRLSNEEFLLSIPWPSTNLFPWPSKRYTSAAGKATQEDPRKMLVMTVNLNRNASMATREDEFGQLIHLKQDIYIHVFLNGTFCNSRLVTSDILQSLSHGYHEELFQGVRVGSMAEKIWIVDGQASVTEQGEQDAALRWRAINQKLRNATNDPEANFSLRFLEAYISALADLSSPQQGLAEMKGNYAVLDVILVGGSKRRVFKRRRDGPSDIELGTTRPAAKKMKISTGSQLPIYHEATSPDLQETMDTQDTVVKPTRPATFDDLYDDSDEVVEAAPKSQATLSRPADFSTRAFSRQTRARVAMSEVSDLGSDESEVEILDGPVRAPQTGHISNLLHLKLREERSAKRIAQRPRPRHGQWRLHRIIHSDTSIASLHSSSASNSLDSGLSKSAEWPSTCSEIVRLRRTKGDLSLPRKSRRKIRYRSTDFDSEDPVATVPGASGPRIRVLEPNHKPDFSNHLTSQPELHGSIAQLVKPRIERNLRRKRERQFFKRTTDIGLTERDMYNWVKADYEARDGAKPWLKLRDHEPIPLARPLGHQADQTHVPQPSPELDEGWNSFLRGKQSELDGENDLMKHSVITVCDDVVGACPEEKAVQFRSEKVLRGLRFIFA